MARQALCDSVRQRPGKHQRDGQDGGRQAQNRVRLHPSWTAAVERLRERYRRTFPDIRIDNSSYEARRAKIGSRVLVRLFDRHVEIRDRINLALLRRYPRSQRPGSVLLPDDERPFHPSRETRRILAQAGDIGDATLALCQQWSEHEGRVGQRKLRGVGGLAKRFLRRLIDQACVCRRQAGMTRPTAGHGQQNRLSCLGSLTWPKVGDFNQANGKFSSWEPLPRNARIAAKKFP